MFTIYIGVGLMSDIRVSNRYITLLYPRLLFTNPVAVTVSVVYILASIYHVLLAGESPGLPIVL